MEVRCHAVLCSTEAKAKAIAVHLHDKLAFALAEFLRGKTRRQNSRLVLARANSVPDASSGASGVPGIPVRTKFLSVGQNFKPSNERSTSAPKLCAISEDHEEETREGTRLARGEVAKIRGTTMFKIGSVAEEEEEEEEEKGDSDSGWDGMG